MRNEDRDDGAVTRALLPLAAMAAAQAASRPPFLWRSLAGAVLGGAVATLVALVAPVTGLDAAALGGGLAALGMVLGGFLDLRAFSRRPKREREQGRRD